MPVLDVILLVCFIPAIIRGISQGLIKQIVSLLSILVGAWCAFQFSSMLTEWLQQYINADQQILGIIAFVIIVIAVIIGLNLLGNLLTKTMEIASLGWANKLLGVLFAILKTAMILGLLIMVFEGLNDKFALVEKESLESCTVYSALESFASFIFPFLKNLVTNA